MDAAPRLVLVSEGARSASARALALGLVLTFVPALAKAQEARLEPEAEAIAVDYDAPAACPGRDAFVGELQARTSRARAPATGERARVLLVRITRREDDAGRGAGYRGQLVIVDGAARSTPREVAGQSCEEVVRALGLVAALAVDPRASTAARPAPTAGVSATEPAREGATRAAGATGASGAAGEAAADGATGGPATGAATATGATAAGRAAEIAVASSGAPADTTARAPARSAALRARVAAGAQLEIAALADAAVAPRVFGELIVGDGVLAPAFRGAASRSLEVARDARLGRAALRWTTFSLEGCPVRLALAARVEVRPCLAFGAGVLEAEASGVTVPQSRTRPWLIAGAHVRIGWAPVPWFSMELEGGLLAPLVREAFFFEPRIPVYEAPAVAAVGRAGMAVHFP